MKRRLFVLSLLALVVVGCNKADDIHVIPVDTTVEEDLSPMCYCVIGADTIQFGHVVSFTKYDPTYLFLDTHNQLVIDMPLVPDQEMPCGVYCSHGHLMFDYTLTTRQLGDMSEIIADGICQTDTTLKLQIRFRGSVTNMNQQNGDGWLARDADTLAVSQLSLQNNRYVICCPQDYGTYSLGRVLILGNPQSGSYDLENNHNVQVFYQKGIPNTCPGETTYQLTKGTLQFSNHDGRYSILIHGATEHWHISLEYNGHCFNATDIPFTW